MARLTEVMVAHTAHAGVQHFALSVLQVRGNTASRICIYVCVPVCRGGCLCACLCVLREVDGGPHFALSERRFPYIHKTHTPIKTNRNKPLSFHHPPDPHSTYTRPHTTQNLAEDGPPVPLAELRRPSVLRLVCCALACHTDDEDVGNAALGLVASLAAQVCIEFGLCLMSVLLVTRTDDEDVGNAALGLVESLASQVIELLRDRGA